MKKVIMLSSALLGVFFLAGCGQQPVSQTQPTTPAPIAQAPTQPVATQPTTPATQPASETSSMQKYQNEKYGYSVNYPNGWFSYTSDSADVFLQPAKETVGGVPGPHADALEIKVTTVSSNASLIQIVKDKYNKAGITFSQETALIGGENGLKITSTCEGMGCGVPEWFVVKNGYLYDFNSNLGYSAEFDKIVASFKFTK
jgi:hypothetical protein